MTASMPRWMSLLFESTTGARHEGLAAYFPESARGRLRPRKGERVFWVEYNKIGFVGNNDGTMVPINAWSVTSTPGNVFDPRKLSSLVDAIESGDRPLVYPGYADFDMDDGALVAIIRDGNHRTLAPFAAGAADSWVMMSEATRQMIDRGRDRHADVIYRAIRKAQRDARAPMIQRARASRLRKSFPAMEELRSAEARYDAISTALGEHCRTMLRRYGPARSAWSLNDQLQRAALFWNLRMKEIYERDRGEWERLVMEDASMIRAHSLENERTALVAALHDMRAQAGLDPRTERLDPATGTVQRRA